MTGYEKAQELLNANLSILTAMAEALLERETLEASDVALLMKGEPLPPIIEQVETEERAPKVVYVTKQKPTNSPIVGMPDSDPEGI